jgi:transcriptional regulator with XRE-family HTH domain
MNAQHRSTRKIFSKNLRKMRLEKGLSQERLASLAGLHRTYIGSVERGERNISIDNIERLAKALGCEVKDLLQGDAE